MSAYNIPHQGHYVCLRHEYISICGNVNVAAVLSVFEVWTTARETEIKRALEKKARQSETKVPSLWLYETAEMINSWVPWVSIKTVRRALDTLIEKGFLSKRKTNDRHDNTQEYLLEIQNVISALKNFWDKDPDEPSSQSDQTPGQVDQMGCGQSDRTPGQVDHIGSQVDQIYNDLSPNDLCLKDQINDQDQDPPTPQNWGTCVEEIQVLDVEVCNQEQEATKSDRQEPQQETTALAKPQNLGVDQGSAPDVDYYFNKTSEFQEKIKLRAEFEKMPVRGDDGKFNPGFVEAWRKWIENAPAYKGKLCTAHHASASISKNLRTVEGLQTLIAVAQSAIEQPTGVTGLPQGVEDMLNQMDQDRRNKKIQGK